VDLHRDLVPGRLHAQGVVDLGDVVGLGVPARASEASTKKEGEEEEEGELEVEREGARRMARRREDGGA
jgi:hypothetical protein